MKQVILFLAENGYAVLFFWILAEQSGLPVPATPVLLAAGALAGQGKLTWTLALAASVFALVIADNFWFQVGRSRGAKVLRLLCRISLEPDSCVRRTEDVFQKYGTGALVLAKFVPGLNLAAAPVMGLSGLTRRRFLMYDTFGALLWAGTFLGVGYVFTNQLERAALYAFRLGGWLLLIICAGLAVFVVLKWRQRRSFLKSLVANRIQPEELKAEMDAGQSLVILDLRHALDSLPDPRTIPGAIRMKPEELQQRYQQIPSDSEIILYCT
jgi:membrane protein DedA with SNARE-associated domain